MKRFICIFLSIMFLFSLVSCGNNDTVSTNTDNSAEVSTDTENSEESKTNVTTDNKTLVVYFSATGATKAAAEIIAETLEADIFEILPQKPYTNDDLNWNNENSRVSIEHNDESKRDVPLIMSVPDNWEQYNTVYIGYPKMEYLNKSVYSA